MLLVDWLSAHMVSPILCSTNSEAGEDASALYERWTDLEVKKKVLSLLWEQYEVTLEPAINSGNVNYTAALERNSQCGRPQFVISASQLEYFSFSGFLTFIGVKEG